MSLTKIFFLILVFFPISLFSQVRIATGVAFGNCHEKGGKYKYNGYSTDLGYNIYYGTGRAKNLFSEAKQAAKRSNPRYKSVTVIQNGWSANTKNNIVIISTETKAPCGHRNNTYGVGYGNSRSSALSDAISNLGMRNWNWSRTRHGYDLEFERSY